MKKIATLFLVLLLLVNVGLCYADNTSVISAASVVGFWYGNLFEENGTAIIELKPDGTVSNNQDSKIEGAWKVNGRQLNIKIGEGEELVFIFNDKNGNFTSEDNKYVLNRNSMSKYAVPEEKKIEDISQFDGSWILYATSDFGNVMSADELIAIMNMSSPWLYTNNTDLIITIENGNVTMFKDGKTQKCELVDNRLIYVDEIVTDNNDSDGNVLGTDTFVSNDSIYLTVQDTLIYEAENGILLVFNRYLK